MRSERCVHDWMFAEVTLSRWGL